jgi:hypothetical protein
MPDAKAEKKKASLGAYLTARRFLFGASVIGIALPFIFALQSTSVVEGATVVAVGLGIFIASMAVGGLIGFVFGIPTSLQGTRAPAPTDGNATSDPAGFYIGNTSLEQISDWLTKILVGVGLTQLASLPSGLVELGNYLAGGLGNLPGANVFAAALVVFALLDGFFQSYLWTRLNLPSLLAESDRLQLVASAKEEGRQEGEANLVAATSEAREVTEAAGAQPAAATEGRFMALWVDDNPDNNVRERRWIERSLPVTFETARSTDEAMNLLTADKGRFAFVISDMSRDFDRTAGFTLLGKMQKANINLPFIIYAGSATPERVAEAQRRGVLGVTTTLSELVSLVTQIVRDLGGAPQGAATDVAAEGSEEKT